jgi:protein-L-isoaspartate(D-aspartate) O-methyltransferase
MKLLEQLRDGGRLVAPIGPEGQQELLRLTRRGDQYIRERLGFVSFVPLVGGIS